MTKLQTLSGQIWQATKWLLTLIGGGVLFTIGFLSATSGGIQLSHAAILAAVAVVVGAFGYAVISIVTSSRLAYAQAQSQKSLNALVDTSKHTVAYVLLWVALIAQVVGLTAAAPLQGRAVYDALQATNAQQAGEAALKERLDLYTANLQALTLVTDYCMKNETNVPETARFLQDCLMFLQSGPPTQGDAAMLAAPLPS